jgi:predicted ABC-type ATPase
LPTLTLIAGPNGSGKSTLTESVELRGRGILVDPDAVARELNPSNPQSVALAAGREVLKRIEEYFRQGETFAVETTLSSHASLALIEDARSRGYETHVIFVALNSPEKNIERVRSRAQLGGHFIPDEDVRRRYYRSIANLPRAIRAADMAKVYDNSRKGHRLVLIARNGVITSRSSNPPAWLQGL